MDHLCTSFAVETTHERQWRIGGSREQPSPAEITPLPPCTDMLEHGLQDCRCTVSYGDAFTNDSLRQRCGSLGEIASGQDNLVGHQRRSLWETPTLAVEHWCDRHGAIIDGHAHRQRDGH